VTDSPTAEEYLAAQPDERRAALEQIRAAIRQVVPDAVERISYRMPAFEVNGRILVWYAAFARHYSIFPATDALREQLGDRLAPHLAGRGTIRFAADQPIPFQLIEDIVRVRLDELAG
jgi:uncharacterized protein YdhG (YjbR/CyaY superfamily)